MKVKELRNLSKEELAAKILNLKEDLSRLYYTKYSGQVDKPHAFKALRKTIARINTLLREEETSKKSKKE